MEMGIEKNKLKRLRMDSRGSFELIMAFMSLLTMKGIVSDKEVDAMIESAIEVFEDPKNEKRFE